MVATAARMIGHRTGSAMRVVASETAMRRAGRAATAAPPLSMRRMSAAKITPSTAAFIMCSINPTSSTPAPPAVASLPKNVAAMSLSGARRPIPLAAVAIIVRAAISMPPMMPATMPTSMVTLPDACPTNGALSVSAIAMSTSLEQRADEAAARNVFPRSSGLLLDRSVTVRQRAAGRLESLLHLNAEQQGDPVDEREVGDDEHGIEDGAVVEPSVAQRAHVRFRGGGRFERGAARPEQQR